MTPQSSLSRCHSHLLHPALYPARLLTTLLGFFGSSFLLEIAQLEAFITDLESILEWNWGLCPPKSLLMGQFGLLRYQCWVSACLFPAVSLSLDVDPSPWIFVLQRLRSMWLLLAPKAAWFSCGFSPPWPLLWKEPFIINSPWISQLEFAIGSCWDSLCSIYEIVSGCFSPSCFFLETVATEII